MRVWDEDEDFQELVQQRRRHQQRILSREEIDARFRLDTYLRNIDAIFDRVFETEEPIRVRRPPSHGYLLLVDDLLSHVTDDGQFELLTLISFDGGEDQSRQTSASAIEPEQQPDQARPAD